MGVPVDWDWTKIGRWLTSLRIFCITQLPQIILKSVESLTVVGTFVVIWYAGWFLVTKEPNDPTRLRMVGLLQTINENWKAFLLLGIPLFYRTVRTFLEEVQEAAGMKRQRPPKERSPEEPNPPGSP